MKESQPTPVQRVLLARLQDELREACDAASVEMTEDAMADVLREHVERLLAQKP